MAALSSVAPVAKVGCVATRDREPRAVCTENLNLNVLMMKPAKDRVWCDGPDPLNRAKRWGISARDTCPFQKSYPDVLVMQPSQDWNGDDGASPLDGSMQGRIFL